MTNRLAFFLPAGVFAILLGIVLVVSSATAAPPSEPVCADCTFTLDATDTQSGSRTETTINLQDVTFVQRPTAEGTGFSLRLGNALLVAHNPTPEAAQATYQALDAALKTCLCNC